MSEKKAKTGFFKGIITEFKKVAWPSKNEIGKQTAAVVSTLIAISVIIKLIDLALRFLLSFTVK